MTDDASPENLQKFLDSDDPALRRMGLSMAKGTGVPKELLPTILRLYMWDGDKSVRAAAKSVFTKYAPAEIQAKVKENWKASYRTLLVTGDRFLDAIPPFLEAFKSQDVFSDIALEPLIKALGDEEWVVRRAAALALGRIGAGRAVGPLIKALEDGRADGGRQPGRRRPRRKTAWLEFQRVSGGAVREYAAWALGKIGDVRAVEPLTKVLEDGRVGVRGFAAAALGKIGDGRAVEPLIKALRDRGVVVRRGAAEALGKIGDARAVEPLSKALGDKNSDVRGDAVTALEELDWKPETDEQKAAYLISKEARGSLVEWGEPAVEPLIKALSDDNEWVRGFAVEALGEIGDERAVKPLIKALGDDEDTVCWHAVEALGEIGEPAVEPLIKALLGSEDEKVRRGAAGALGQIGDARAVEPLIKVLSGDEGYAAAEALGAIGDVRAVEPLIGVLSDGEAYVRRKAVEVLGKLGDVRAVEPLIEALDDEPWVRVAVAEALGKVAEANIKGKEKENVLRFLESDDPAMVRMGASMLKGILEK